MANLDEADCQGKHFFKLAIYHSRLNFRLLVTRHLPLVTEFIIGAFGAMNSAFGATLLQAAKSRPRILSLPLRKTQGPC